MYKYIYWTFRFISFPFFLCYSTMFRKYLKSIKRKRSFEKIQIFGDNIIFEVVAFIRHIRFIKWFLFLFENNKTLSIIIFFGKEFFFEHCGGTIVIIGFIFDTTKTQRIFQFPFFIEIKAHLNAKSTFLHFACRESIHWILNLLGMESFFSFLCCFSFYFRHCVANDFSK